MKIRLRVREIAESKHINRATLQRQADMTYETVHLLWKDPYRDVSLLTIAKIARALNVPITDLFTIEENDRQDE